MTELFGRVLLICSIGVIVGCIINILSVLYSCFLPFVKKNNAKGGAVRYFLLLLQISKPTYCCAENQNLLTNSCARHVLG